MNILDLFSGTGGVSLGFESANFKDYDFTKLLLEQTCKSDRFFKTVAFCECDKNCQRVLKKHWQITPIFEDVKSLKEKEAKKFCANNPQLREYGIWLGYKSPQLTRLADILLKIGRGECKSTT